MLFTQALLVTLVGIIATIDYNGPLFMIHRPLVTSAMVGLVLGDFTQGVLIGSALELTWLGVTGIEVTLHQILFQVRLLVLHLVFYLVKEKLLVSL